MAGFRLCPKGLLATLFVSVAFCLLGAPLGAQNRDQTLRADLASGGVARRQAMWYVYQEHRDELLPEVAEYLFKSDDSQDHAAILNVFRAYGAALERHLPNWVDILDRFVTHDVDPDVLVACIDRVTFFREHRLVFALTRLADHPRRRVRLKAYAALSDLGNDTLIPVLLRLLNEGEPLQRMYALEGFALYSDRRLTQFLAQSVRDESKSVRIFAVEAIAASPGAGELVGTLVQRYQTEPDPEVRERILEVVGRERWVGQAFLIHRGLADDSALVRRAALMAARTIPDRSAAYPISQQLTNEVDRDLKILGTDVLMELGRSGGGLGLVRLLEGDNAPEVRARAALALGVLGERVGVPALVRALDEDGAERVRIEAAGALGELRDDRAIESLRAAAVRERESYEVRSAAVLALSRNRSPAAVQALGELESGAPDPVISRQARQLLQSGGR
ncbi:MAG: HEAT repeat domain-containing protein [Spirochaetales bacterium]|nr:HEAT repeat domain-containing protein [Leptospiraceae bacterium]MCP5480204.1 HEAT repeat domain-containing protein [Spirochaetales bacterium]MCP5486397.1 HEAT repeat domain-containing protein [Spirochaetales bacterium]